MPTSDEIAELKQGVMPCIACFCFEQSCMASNICSPICFSAGKFCCVQGSIGCECPPCHCEPDPCYSEEKGICELVEKMACMYTEMQFPPGKDIGIGCCGVGCCRSSDDKPADGQEAQQYGS